MMKLILFFEILLLTGPAFAEPLLTAQNLFDRGLRWRELGQPQRAIEAFEQSYLERNDVLCLYYMAESYVELSQMPTRTAAEILENKRRAFDLYNRFVERIQAEASPRLLEKTRSRIEPLHHEIDQLAPQVMTERGFRKRSSMRSSSVRKSSLIGSMPFKNC